MVTTILANILLILQELGLSWHVDSFLLKATINCHFITLSIDKIFELQLLSQFTWRHQIYRAQ